MLPSTWGINTFSTVSELATKTSSFCFRWSKQRCLEISLTMQVIQTSDLVGAAKNKEWWHNKGHCYTDLKAFKTYQIILRPTEDCRNVKNLGKTGNLQKNAPGFPAWPVIFRARVSRSFFPHLALHILKFSHLASHILNIFVRSQMCVFFTYFNISTSGFKYFSTRSFWRLASFEYRN